jgi:hypothetical protein
MINQERQNNHNIKPNWELVAGATTTAIGGDFLLNKIAKGPESTQDLGLPLFLTTVGLVFTIRALNEIIAKRRK